MSVGYEPQWIRKWGKRTQCNNTCDIKISIWPEFECTQWILFSNINVLMCYNRRQHTHLGKVTKEEHLESEFLFLSCMYLSNPTVPISIYEGKKKKRWKKTYALLKPQLVKAKKVQQGVSLRKKKKTWGTEMTNITVDFSLFPIFYDEVCDFSGSKVAVFICSNGDGFPLILSSVPKIPFSGIFGQDEIFSFIFPFSKCFQRASSRDLDATTIKSCDRCCYCSESYWW